jgi:5-methylcytosine-specific restriction enzyme A
MTNFYKMKKWLSKRANILRRDEYLCRECKRYGKTVAATTIHHCNPLLERYDLRLNSLNLISVCARCHGTFHNRDSDVLTDIGEQWRERANKLMEQEGI